MQKLKVKGQSEVADQDLDLLLSIFNFAVTTDLAVMLFNSCDSISRFLRLSFIEEIN